jgi:hypothetical protein
VDLIPSPFAQEVETSQVLDDTLSQATGTAGRLCRSETAPPHSAQATTSTSTSQSGETRPATSILSNACEGTPS